MMSSADALTEYAVLARRQAHHRQLRGALFLSGPEMDPANEERLMAWWARWTEHTGRRPDIAAHVRQRAAGMTFPLQRGAYGR